MSIKVHYIDPSAFLGSGTRYALDNGSMGMIHEDFASFAGGSTMHVPEATHDIPWIMIRFCIS